MTINILLVDDEKDYILALARRLRLRDYNVQTVFGGNQALEELSANPYDVVVLDVLMPEKDGIETYREINHRYPDIPVIMHTGHAKLDTAIEEMKKGAFDYVVKPVELDELVDKINLAYNARLVRQNKKAIPTGKPGILTRWINYFKGMKAL